MVHGKEGAEWCGLGQLRREPVQLFRRDFAVVLAGNRGVQDDHA